MNINQSPYCAKGGEIMSTKNNAPKRDEFVTPYEVAKILKAEFGIERKPQMIYNYVRNNLIETEIFESQRLIRRSVAMAWCEKFAAKVTSK
jgi:alanine dehydrogenase